MHIKICSTYEGAAWAEDTAPFPWLISLLLIYTVFGTASMSRLWWSICMAMPCTTPGLKTELGMWYINFSIKDTRVIDARVMVDVFQAHIHVYVRSRS